MLDEDQDSRRASSRGIIPRAKIKTVKMTFVIVFGKITFRYLSLSFNAMHPRTWPKSTARSCLRR